MPELAAPELRARRAAAQRLHRPPATGPADVVGHLLAVQAQDLRAARLALRARAPGFTAAGVDAALTQDRSIVVDWLNRGTLHLVRAEDHGWLHALTAPTRLAAHRRRLGQQGVDPGEADRAVQLIGRALAADGPLSREELGDRLNAADIRTAGQALPHLLGLAALRGVAVLGPVRDARQAFALRDDWIGPHRTPDRDIALAELARRYLVAHGPATPEDLATWSGLPLRDARAGLQRIAGGLEHLGGDLHDLRSRTPAPPPPRLLPAYDPYLLGWRDRRFAVAPEHARRVHPGGGVLRAVALLEGQAAGTWSLRRGTPAIEPFADASPDIWADEAADVAAFLRYPPGTG